MNSTSLFVNKLKQDFNINVNLSDVIFTKTNIDLYNNNENRSTSFGEKLCLLYIADCTVFNMQFSMKILTFNYDKSNEVLKLDINIHDKWIEKELASCRNFLQRNRNLNLTFSILTEFAKYIEARRLICDVVFMKEPRVTLTKDEQGGLKIKCLDMFSKIYFATYWRIEWNLKDYSIKDFIEFYYTNFDNPSTIKTIMENIIQPSQEFQTKLKLWKSFMDAVRASTKDGIAVVRPDTIHKRSNDTDVLVISDTEDDFVSSTSGANKRRKLNDSVCCSTSVIYTIPD
ncbi:uncharacterized protein LOC109609342 [Aethina tumida]|uniref:uncharacterized protein LOC109609342 n=1 Tax=Aethina tumida TaxID=116153 RepID=UPI0021483845|nr:uncharacterized protein LOC109609342 [Aethina tumida]